MTFTQLRTFALVAELGSLRAAADTLGVSEPAVSAAVAALRTDLGDPLFRRTGGGITLTPGGRALAVRARELVRLADRTRREVAHATSAGRLRVLATAGCGEHVAGAVLAAFTRRVPRVAIDLTLGDAEWAAVALADDVADIVLGVRPVPAAGQALDAVPFLRYERVVVAAPDHPLTGLARVRRADLQGARWFAGPAGIEAGSEEARWAELLPDAPDVERLGSEAEALDAVRGGGGLVLALAHAVRDDVRRGRVVRLPVEGTPVTGLWWAGVPGEGTATSAARALQRFLTTPDATSALLSGPARRDRPGRLCAWSSGANGPPMTGGRAAGPTRMTNTEVVRAAFDAYRAQDRAAAEALIAGDYSFTSPQDDHLGKAAFLERCFPTADRFRSQVVLELVPAGADGVFLLYEYELDDGQRFRNTEFSRVEGGRLTETQVFFGGAV